ncbi:hypothetical protein PTNB85_01449 [Pyrenophora teres f. teres]|nr:hypothetical protein HRS9139_00037 [Pyrenophora teres f. teres]KAE8847606.1 hypothetical protein PTNB85_01449 [Pyrenophora teres f. teres]
MNSLQELEALEPRLHRLGENSQRKRERINELRLQIRRATKSARKLQSECNNHVIYYSRSQCRHLADLMQHKLPAELRDMIYEHLVVEDRPIYVGPYYHIRTYDGPNLDPPLPDEESDDVTRTVGSHVGPRITWASVLERRRLENPEADILDESETEDVDNDGVNPEIIERIRKLDLSCSNERSNHNEGKMILPDGRVKQVHTYHPPEDMVLPNSYLLNPRYVGPVISAEIQKVYYTQNTFSICSVRQAIRNFGTLHSGYFMQTWEEEGKPRKVPDDLKLQPLFYPVNHVRDLQIRVKCEQCRIQAPDMGAYDKNEYMRGFLRQMWSNISKLDLFLGRRLPFGMRIEMVLMTNLGDVDDVEDGRYAKCAYVNFLQCIRNMIYKLMYDHDDVCVYVTHYDEYLQLSRDITRVFALTKEQWEYEKSVRDGPGEDMDKFYLVAPWPEEEEGVIAYGYHGAELRQYIGERWGLKEALDTTTTYKIREGRYWPRAVRADGRG